MSLVKDKNTDPKIGVVILATRDPDYNKNTRTHDVEFTYRDKNSKLQTKKYDNLSENHKNFLTGGEIPGLLLGMPDAYVEFIDDGENFVVRNADTIFATFDLDRLSKVDFNGVPISTYEITAAPNKTETTFTLTYANFNNKRETLTFKRADPDGKCAKAVEEMSHFLQANPWRVAQNKDGRLTIYDDYNQELCFGELIYEGDELSWQINKDGITPTPLPAKEETATETSDNTSTPLPETTNKPTPPVDHSEVSVDKTNQPKSNRPITLTRILGGFSALSLVGGVALFATGIALGLATAGFDLAIIGMMLFVVAVIAGVGAYKTARHPSSANHSGASDAETKKDATEHPGIGAQSVNSLHAKPHADDLARSERSRSTEEVVSATQLSSLRA